MNYHEFRGRRMIDLDIIQTARQIKALRAAKDHGVKGECFYLMETLKRQTEPERRRLTKLFIEEVK